LRSGRERVRFRKGLGGASAVFKRIGEEAPHQHRPYRPRNIRVPTAPDDSVRLAIAAVADARGRDAAVICFPECFVPGYRWPGQQALSPDPAFLNRAWAAVADAARLARVAVVLGTERVTDRGLQITACVINPDGTIAGWQDKSQIDPSEEGTYPALGGFNRVAAKLLGQHTSSHRCPFPGIG
jgi:hypothetical protein